ncbi:hypothetical protein RJT34_12314 [Clitoria ternatea]|uniref:Uncharacterized protein n=1 Tax=Clitoria ternatea TaxID=43366 RepID=A0AAN9JLJ7_CLITE
MLIPLISGGSPTTVPHLRRLSVPQQVRKTVLPFSWEDRSRKHVLESASSLRCGVLLHPSCQSSDHYDCNYLVDRTHYIVVSASSRAKERAFILGIRKRDGEMDVSL